MDIVATRELRDLIEYLRRHPHSTIKKRRGGVFVWKANPYATQRFGWSWVGLLGERAFEQATAQKLLRRASIKIEHQPDVNNSLWWIVKACVLTEIGRAYHFPPDQFLTGEPWTQFEE